MRTSPSFRGVLRETTSRMAGTYALRKLCDLIAESKPDACTFAAAFANSSRNGDTTATNGAEAKLVGQVVFLGRRDEESEKQARAKRTPAQGIDLHND